MRDHQRQQSLGYLVAIGATAGTVLLRWLLDPVVGDYLPLATLYGAVAFAVWFGGYRPALLAAVLGYLACDYFFIQPRGRLGFNTVHDFIGLVLYLFSCGIIIGFGEAMRVSRRRFEELARQQDQVSPSAGIEAIRRKHSLYDVGVIGFGLTLAVLLIGGVLGVVNAWRLAENERSVAHTQEVMRELEALLSTLKDAETGQRGYLLTENDKYLQPYEEAMRRVDAVVAHLKELMSDNADQQARLAGIEQKITTRLDELRRTVALLKGGDRTAAMKIVHSDTGKAMMDDVRERVAVMRQAEEQLLRHRAAESEASFRTTVVSILLPAIIGVVLVCIVFYLSRRNLLVRQRAAEVLAEQRERLRTTLASIGDAVISTDTDGRITNMNAVAESLTGWKKEEATGRQLDAVFRIVNEETRQPVHNPATKAMKEGVIVGRANHTILIAKGGTELPIDDSAAPIRCEKGEVVGCVLVFRDVTERRRAENERQFLLSRLDALITHAPIGIALFDPDLRFITLNEQAAAVDGIPKQAHVGKTMSELLPELGPKVEALLRQVRDSGEPIVGVEMEGETPAAPGRQRHWIANYYPVRNEGGQTIAIGAVALEITGRKRAEQELRSAEEQVRSVVNTVLDGIITIEESGTVQSFNPAAEKLFGYKGEEIVGRNVKMLMPEPYRSEHDGYLANYRRTGEAKIIGIGREVEGRRKDGTTFPMDLAVSEFRLGDRRYFTGIVRDITEQKRAERLLRESEAQFRQLADAMPQIVWTARPDGYLDYYNERWYEYTGFPRGEYGQQSWEPILHPDDVERCLETYFGCVKAEKPYQIEYRFKDRKTGGYRWFLGRAVPVRDEQGRIIRWFGTCTDIDDTKKAQEALKEADRHKDEFLATLAHELRNPLAPICNSIELLRRADGNTDLIGQASRMMERQVGQMVRLVDDLLDISRITQGKVQLRKERVELAAVVQSAVEASRPLIEAQGHELTVTLPPDPIYLEADPTRLGQAFANLLNNAAKYSEKGGRIWLTAERQGGEVTVSVRDTGIGISAEHLPRIFEMFSQVEPALERSQGGLGIGLALVRGLVELHGGTIEARSAGVGRGSEFIIHLPVVEAQVEAPQEPGDGDKGKIRTVRPSRILVVDDNRDAADSLALMLRMTGHETDTAYDGLEAVQAAATFRPQVVLLDIGLPKVSGYEAARLIREQPWGKGMALLALTGWGQDEDKRRAMEAGFDHHLTKPVEPAALEKLLALMNPVPQR